MHTIGIAGLGIMGLRAAERLRECGFAVRGHDPFTRAAERAAQAGFVLAAGPDSLAAATDCVLMFVPGPKETEEVIAGENGILKNARNGLVVVNMSTTDPEGNIRMGELLKRQGAGFVDAPVLGRPAGVGSWAFPVGGEKEHVEAVTPVLAALGGSTKNIFHLGPVGSGNKLKLLNNMMFGAINACAAEIMALATRLGISQKMLLDVAVAANAGTVSSLYREIGTRISEQRYADSSFTVDMLIKDNHLCLEMARKLNLPMPVGNAIDTLNRLASLHGLGAEDNAAMWKAVDEFWGKQS
jgi:3-hydroxyisobutyrate dehydrogenase-like beta-hydroxyacid dehydrogenase